MSDSLEKPWSDNPNAPQIAPWVYITEKEIFAGCCTGAVAYGIVVVLFFRCMGALLDPVNRTSRGTKWALVAHTVAMFSFLTIPIPMVLHKLSNWYINNRNFPGDDEDPPGPFGYSGFVDPKPIKVAYALMFPLNQWLADGLLLHRCYIIYSMNYWVMAFPCMMYLASVATSLTYVYQASQINIDHNFGTSYFSISLSLSILLTLMIVTRLILHRRNIRKAIGASGGAGGLYTAVVTMLIESYALYAATFLTYVVPWSSNSYVASSVSTLLASVQVIAPYLVTLRVANRRALTNEMISGTGKVGSIRFGYKSQGTVGDGTLSDGDPMSSMGANSEAANELGDGVEYVVEEVPL